MSFTEKSNGNSRIFAFFLMIVPIISGLMASLWAYAITVEKTASKERIVMRKEYNDSIASVKDCFLNEVKGLRIETKQDIKDMRYEIISELKEIRQTQKKNLEDQTQIFNNFLNRVKKL